MKIDQVIIKMKLEKVLITNIYIFLFIHVHTVHINVCTKSLDPSYKVTNYIKWGKSPWTCTIYLFLCQIKCHLLTYDIIYTYIIFKEKGCFYRLGKKKRFTKAYFLL